MFTPTGHHIPRNEIVEVQTSPQPDYGVNGQLYAPGARIGGDERQYRSLAPANGGGEPQYRSLAPSPPPGGRR